MNVPQEELSHYSKATIDLMYEFPHGVEELEGIANRTDFDLGSHSKNQTDLDITADVIRNKDSNARLATQNVESKEWEVPYVIEPSAGVDRGVLAILNEAYKEENLENDKNRVVLALKPHLSPIKAAVIPIKKNDSTIVSFSKEIKIIYKNLDSAGLFLKILVILVKVTVNMMKLAHRSVLQLILIPLKMAQSQSEIGIQWSRKGLRLRV